MMTVAQALEMFISGLELTDAEQEKVAKQQKEVRGKLNDGLSLVQDFLSGSYARNTAIRPLNDIDLFIVLDRGKHADLASGSPGACLKAVRKALKDAYPNKELPILQNRSVNIEFTGTGISYDVVPAFLGPGADVYSIPDRETNRWIKSNPRIHQEFSTQANERAGKRLKPLIKALKRWNTLRGKPLRSFHLEVMACRILTTPGPYLDGLSILFHGLASAVQGACPEPAGLGPDLDADMTPGKRQHASELLGAAAKQVDRAIAHTKDGRTGQAHYLLRDLFGDEYPEKGTPESGGNKGPAIVTSGSVDSSTHRYG